MVFTAVKTLQERELWISDKPIIWPKGSVERWAVENLSEEAKAACEELRMTVEALGFVPHIPMRPNEAKRLMTEVCPKINRSGNAKPEPRAPVPAAPETKPDAREGVLSASARNEWASHERVREAVLENQLRDR